MAKRSYTAKLLNNSYWYAKRTNERKKNVGDKSKISRAGRTGTHRCSFWLVGGREGNMKVGGWGEMGSKRLYCVCAHA